MNANHCHEIDDISGETFHFISDLIAASRTDEQMIYREAEIDELWRLLVAHQKLAEGENAQHMSNLIGGVMVVHDMLEDTANAQAAATKLRDMAQHAPHHA